MELKKSLNKADDGSHNNARQFLQNVPMKRVEMQVQN
jgi:hypothetical protein